MILSQSCVSSADNFVEDIVPDLGFELTLPYIMYRNKTNEVLRSLIYIALFLSLQGERMHACNCHHPCDNAKALASSRSQECAKAPDLRLRCYAWPSTSYAGKFLHAHLKLLLVLEEM